MEPVAKSDNSDVGGEFALPGAAEAIAEPTVAVAGAALLEDPAEAGRTPEGAPPLAGDPEFYEGLWNGIPLFKCPYCSYTALATHGGPGAIEIHILTQIERGSPGHRAALDLKEE